MPNMSEEKQSVQALTQEEASAAQDAEPAKAQDAARDAGPAKAQDAAQDVGPAKAQDAKPAEKHLAQTIIPVESAELTDRVQDMKDGGYRLGQLCAAKVGEQFHLLYSFDKDCTLTNLKLAVKEGEAIPSITGVYWPAFIYENEIQDLFGFEFKHLKLNYKGKFFKVAEPTPWNPKKQTETT
jgi:ech hydrogenase subunit D